MKRPSEVLDVKIWKSCPPFENAPESVTLFLPRRKNMVPFGRIADGR
jgi:hypothetical protein